jgi:chromosome segregation ATPase
VGSAREYLENNTIGREAFVIFDGLLAVAEEMRGHLDGDKRKMYGIIKNLEQEREEARARVKKLEGENESLREALNLDITMNKELQARVKELEELVDLLKQNDGDLVISQLRIRVSELKDERENLVRRVRELEGENTEMAHRELDHKMQIDGRDQRIMELEAEVRGQLVTAKELDDARCARIAELEAELKSERREHAEWQGQSDRWKELYQKECEKRQDDLVQRGRQVKGWISRGCIVDGVNLGCDFVDVQFNRDPDYPIPVTLTIEEGDK